MLQFSQWKGGANKQSMDFTCKHLNELFKNASAMSVCCDCILPWLYFNISRDVGVGMHSKYLWSIGQWKPLDGIQIFLHLLEDWNLVALVELKRALEHVLSKPVLCSRRRTKDVACVWVSSAWDAHQCFMACIQHWQVCRGVGTGGARGA